MPYETGSSSGPNDLLDKLRIFALANGWTIDYSGPRTNVGGASQGNGLNALALNKGGLFFVLYHDTASNNTSNPTPRIRAYTYPGPWAASAGSDVQANQTSVVAANNLAGPYQAYHFFTDAAHAYLHAVVEVVPGRFGHFGLGRMNKAGGGSAVPYVHGLAWNYSTSYINNPSSTYHAAPWDSACQNSTYRSTAFRADSDGVVPRNFAMDGIGSSGTLTAYGGFTQSSASYMPYVQQIARINPSALTGRAPLLPLIALIERTEQVFSFVGAAPDMRFVRIDNITDGQVLTIGADQWKCFPMIRKNGPALTESSGAFGYAYRIVP